MLSPNARSTALTKARDHVWHELAQVFQDQMWGSGLVHAHMNQTDQTIYTAYVGDKCVTTCAEKDETVKQLAERMIAMLLLAGVEPTKRQRKWWAR